MLRCVLVSLCFALPVLAQNPPGYSTVFNAAKESGRPLVIFVACEGREIAGAETLQCSRFPDAIGPQIIVADARTLACKRLAPNATDSEIAAAFPQQMKRGNVREYVSEGRVYREYYSVPVYSATTQATPIYNALPAQQYYAPPIYSLPYQSPYSTGIGLYGGVQLGTFGGVYGGACVGGNCPQR